MVSSLLFAGSVSAQEVDDMYFFKSDRQAITKRTTRANRPNSLSQPAYENHTPASKYANPDYVGNNQGSQSNSYYPSESQQGNSNLLSSANGNAYDSRGNRNSGGLFSGLLSNISLSMGFGYGSSMFGLGYSPYGNNNFSAMMGMGMGYGGYSPYGYGYSPYGYGNSPYGYGGYSPYGYNNYNYSRPTYVVTTPSAGEGRRREVSRVAQKNYTNVAKATLRYPSRVQAANAARDAARSVSTPTRNSRYSSGNSNSSSPWRNSYSAPSGGSNYRTAAPSTPTRSSSSMRSYRRR